MKLLLDEQYSSRIADQLRARGHDVTAVGERRAQKGVADRPLIVSARQEGRALVTENVGDFQRIAADFARTGTPHAGIILANVHRFPRSRDGTGGLVRALHELLIPRPEDDALADQVVWLEPAGDPG